MAMGTALSGGCACGAVRYACTAEPLFALNCHCRDCQRETGSAFAPILAVPSSAFAVTRGIPRYFDVTADSGYLTRRAFCGECGVASLRRAGLQPGHGDDPGR
jgi:hypothetical protein